MNVLLFLIDTLRADHLGCYGYFRKTSPNIDQLARDGILFRDHYASGVPTGPGITSIITGMFPINHRFYLTPHNVPNSYQLDDNILTLAEVMCEAGYLTSAFDNLVSFRSHIKHFVRGYEYYINVTRTAKWLHHHVWADLINHRLIPWIEDHYKERFFLFVHYWDPHLPYNQPKEFREIFHHDRGNLSDLVVKEARAGYKYVPGWGKVDQIFEGMKQPYETPIPGETFTTEYSIDQYDGEIAYVDSRLGQVVEKLIEKDIYDNTLIVVTSDHGEQLGQHGAYGHGWLHDTNVYVPLIMTHPTKLPKRVQLKGFAQQVDIPSAVFGMADIDFQRIVGKMREHAKKSGNPAYSSDVRGFTDCRNLLDLVKGEQVRKDVFCEAAKIFLSRGSEDRLKANVLGQRAIRTSEWKLIRYSDGRKELFNVQDDPMEVVNLAQERTDVLESLTKRLEEQIESISKGQDDPMLRLSAARVGYDA